MTVFDMSESIQARSDQQNYDDYVGGISRDVTISEVRGGSAEQPVELHLVEFPGKAYKPSKSMRRVLVYAWGTDGSAYVGRRLRLYGDPDVRFGGKVVGGIKVGALSHIDKPFTIALTESRGSRRPHKVDVLPDAPPPITAEHVTAFEQRIQAATTTAELDAIARDLKARDLGQRRSHLQAAWSERRTALDTATEQPVLGEGEQQ